MVTHITCGIICPCAGNLHILHSNHSIEAGMAGESTMIYQLAQNRPLDTSFLFVAVILPVEI